MRSRGYEKITAERRRTVVDSGPTRVGGRLRGIAGGSGAEFGGKLAGRGIGCGFGLLRFGEGAERDDAGGADLLAGADPSDMAAAEKQSWGRR